MNGRGRIALVVILVAGCGCAAAPDPAPAASATEAAPAANASPDASPSAPQDSTPAAAPAPELPAKGAAANEPLIGVARAGGVATGGLVVPPSPLAPAAPPARGEEELRQQLIDLMKNRQATRPDEPGLAERLWLEHLAAAQYPEARALVPTGEGGAAELLLQALSHYKLGELTEALETLDRLRQRMASALPLRAGKAVFCRRIVGYGDYEPATETVFEPDAPVLIYLEVENYTLVPQGEGEATGYRIDLEIGLSVVDRAGAVQWERPLFQRVQYPVKSPLRDFFLTFQGLRLPARLDSGEHTLKITLRDLHKDGEALAQIPFKIK